MERYKISQVAKKLNISRTALIHYDNSGLLSPSYRNEKNYRFYTSDDIKKLEFIIALKESGLSLKEINAYMSDETSKTSIELLAQQQKVIENKMKELRKQKKLIANRIKHLKKFQSLDLYEGIKENDYPEGNLVIEAIGYGPLMSYDAAIKRLANKVNIAGQLSSKFGICFDISHTDKEGNFPMKYVFDYLNAENSVEKTETIPSGLFIRTLHYGQYHTAHQTVHQLKEYAKNKGYLLDNVAYFVPLFDYWDSVTDEHISEILIGVNRKK